MKAARDNMQNPPPAELAAHGPDPRPSRTTPDRCSFLTILKLREIKRGKRRAPEAE
jgi:hypothetical protein